jgi:hypothetical protein
MLGYDINIHDMRVHGGHSAKANQMMLQQEGLIYLSKHEGWYSVSDETFYPQSGVQQAVEPATGRKHMVNFLISARKPRDLRLIGIGRDWKGSGMDIRDKLPLPTISIPRATTRILQAKPSMDIA